MKHRKLNVGIIGCGPSGLVTLKELKDEGHDGTVFEKSSVIGGIFTTFYQEGYMVSSNLVTMFSDFIGGEEDELLKKPRMLSFVEYSKYLNDYAEHFNLKSSIKFDSLVESVWKDIPTGKWKIRVKSILDEHETVHLFDRIAISSGTHQKRSMPNFTGQDRYQGKIKHLQDIKRFDDFSGKRVCIVGSGEGASDMAVAAAKYSKAAFISIRKDHGFIIPRYAPPDYDPADLNTSRAFWSLPRCFGQFYTYLLLFFGFVEYYFKGTRNIQEKVHKESLYMNWKQTKTSNIMNTYGTKSAGLVEALVEYNGKRKPGIRELTEKTIIFNDGTQEEVDEIICCTAFINQFPFLEIADKQADPNHSKLVRQIAEDARISHDLYKHCVHPDIGDELFFIGFVRPCFGAIPPLSEMQARWYALLCSQKLQLPDKETMIQESKIYVKYLEWQLTPYRTNRIVNLTDFLIYSDDLARTIGCRPNLLKMFFTEPYLSLKCICGPIMSVHYRLTGPNSQPVQARRIIKRVKWIKHSNFFCLGLSLSHGIFWFCGIQACKPAAWYRISI